jgi:hypothetical protein
VIRDDFRRREPLLFQELAHETGGSAGVPLPLNEHLEDLALGVDGAPEILRLAGDRHHHFV